VPGDLLTVGGVSKRFGDREVLRDLRFSLRAGEAVGYLGPNGSGKTTTLKLLSGLARPTAGTVQVLGRDPARDRVRGPRGLGALVETPGVPGYLTGRDLLEYVARVKGIPAAEIRAAAHRGAASMNVAEQIDRPFGTLSTGLARRMLLGAALVGEPQILILDEPTLGLDPAARSDLRALLRTLARTGTTLLLSTHLVEDVEAVCSRVLFLRDGALVGDERLPLGTEPSETYRTIRLEFAADVTLDALSRAAGPGVDVQTGGGRSAVLRWSGGDPEQSALVGRLVRAGLPVLTASRPTPDLARRYMELVGREDAA
jgi:ABC-2 type transport system ATP-binding protein